MTKNKKTANDKNIQNQAPGKHLELENQLKRALADYQNLERRVEEERKLLGQLSAALLIEKLLPILDSLENAQQHLNDEGIELVIKQFRDVLKQEGVEEIEAENQQFNPNLHEAIEVSAGHNEDRVVKVHAKGYKLNDRIIRAAKVTVEKNRDHQESNNLNTNKGEL